MQSRRSEGGGSPAKSGESPLSHATSVGSDFKPEVCLNGAGKKGGKERFLLSTDPSFRLSWISSPSSCREVWDLSGLHTDCSC